MYAFMPHFLKPTDKFCVVDTPESVIEAVRKHAPTLGVTIAKGVAIIHADHDNKVTAKVGDTIVFTPLSRVPLVVRGSVAGKKVTFTDTCFDELKLSSHLAHLCRTMAGHGPEDTARISDMPTILRDMRKAVDAFDEAFHMKYNQKKEGQQ